MSIIRLYILTCFLLSLAACSDTSQRRIKTSTFKDTNHFPNIIDVKLFGDTMRLVVEKEGNTLIKHYIDLQGVKGGNKFDDSYTVTCIYERRNIDSTIKIDKKSQKIQAVLVENYETDFSKGRNYYFITHVGDTIFDRKILEWIR